MTAQAIHTEIAYRRMAEADLPPAQSLSQAMRWPHRLEDWHFVYRLGTGFVAEMDGTVIGTALCWKQGGGHGTLGMIIVSADHQGKGIGRKLMNLVLDALGSDCCVRLIATPAGQPLYETLGFEAVGTIHQHQGIVKSMACIPPALAECIRLASRKDTASIVALANLATGMAREDVIHNLLQVAEVAVLEINGELAGFSIMRRFGRGHVVGPVVAPNEESAKALIAYWSDAYAGSFVRVDVIGDCGLSAWLTDAGLPQVDTGLLMEKNRQQRNGKSARQFAIANQALC